MGSTHFLAHCCVAANLNDDDDGINNVMVGICWVTMMMMMVMMVMMMMMMMMMVMMVMARMVMVIIGRGRLRRAILNIFKTNFYDFQCDGDDNDDDNDAYDNNGDNGVVCTATLQICQRQSRHLD